MEGQWDRTAAAINHAGLGCNRTAPCVQRHVLRLSSNLFQNAVTAVGFFGGLGFFRVHCKLANKRNSRLTVAAERTVNCGTEDWFTLCGSQDIVEKLVQSSF